MAALDSAQAAQAAQEHKRQLQEPPPLRISEDGKTAHWRKATNEEMHKQWGSWEDRPE